LGSWEVGPGGVRLHGARLEDGRRSWEVEKLGGWETEKL